MAHRLDHPFRPRPLTSATLGAAIALVALPAAGYSRGEESFGNDAKTAQPGWAPGVLDAVNLKTRVYSRWVNGNESFFFQGKADAINEALEKLAAVQCEVREVFLLPLPGGTETFQGKPVTCDWELRVPSGIYLGLAKNEKGTKVLTRHATLVIFAGSPRVELRALRFPAGLTLLGAEDLIARYLDGLKGKDDTVAGQAAHLLGELAPWLDKLDPLVASLDSPSTYIQACAAGTLARVGKRATPALPRLKSCLEKAPPDSTQGFRDAITAIEEASEQPARDPALLKGIRRRIEDEAAKRR